MDEAILEAQRELVAAVDDAGWDVTEAELSVYESPWADDDAPEVSVTISARRLFPEAETPDGGRRDAAGPDGSGSGADASSDSDDDNPFRVR